MNPYRDPSATTPGRARLRRLFGAALPRPVSLVVFVGALGWPAYFVAPLVHDPRLEPLPRPALAEPPPACPAYEEKQPEPAAAPPAAEPSAAPAAPIVSAREAQASVGRLAREVVAALEAGDFARVAEHAATGGIDVATTWTEIDAAPHFTTERLQRCARDRKKRVYRDALDVARTCPDFFAELLHHEKFSESARVLFNADPTEGTSTAELRKNRPGAIVVDHHIFAAVSNDGDDGPEERHLYLVFVPEGEAWRLAAIAGSN
jgi:hypothetical protein